MSYVFDSATLERIVRESVMMGGTTQERVTRVLAAIEVEYPGLIEREARFHLVGSAGGGQQVAILFASAEEYLTMVGIPCSTDGFSGRYHTTITDYIVDGSLVNHKAGDFESTVYRPGDTSVFVPGEVRNYAVPDKLWMLEYARGPIFTMFALPLADTLFRTLDIRSSIDLGKDFLAQVKKHSIGAGAWRNWMGNLVCYPRAIVRPRSLGELQGAIAEAHRDRRKVRLYGAKHSWSSLVPTNDTLIDMKGLHRVLDVNEAEGTVEIEAGATIGDLVNAADEKGWVVESTTVATHFTVGGVVATGSHGTGHKVDPMSDSPPPDRAFSDYIVSAKVVRSDGALVEVKRHDPDMPALRCSLGALGVLYSVKVKCFPAERFRVQNIVMPLEQAIEAIPRILEEHAAVEMFWPPYTANAIFRTIDPTSDPVTFGPLQKAKKIAEQYVVDGVLGEIGLFVVTKVAPGLTPWITKLSSFAFRPGAWVMSPADAYHYQYYYPKVWDSEFGVPITASKDAWKAYVRVLDEMLAEGKYPVNMVVHSRFLSGSSTWLAPEGGRNTCFIEAVTAKGTRHVEELYRRMEVILSDDFEGRAHWAKVWYDWDRLHRAYGGDLRRFEEARKRWDPEGMFLNGFLTRLLRPYVSEPMPITTRFARSAYADNGAGPDSVPAAE